MILGFEQIKELLPQRFPFLMLDRIIEYEPGKKIAGIKNVTGNELFFQGHFPEEAVMPGAMILESMAQVAIIFFQLSTAELEQKRFLFGRVKANFTKPVVPGDVLVIEMYPVKIISSGGIMEGKVTVDGTIVTRAELSFSAGEKTSSNV
jgi:3-hydroxyacyl-[acyl-carrier-protein] dehydratase